MQTPRLLQAEVRVTQSVISAQSQLKIQLSKPLSTVASTGGGPVWQGTADQQDGAGLMLANLQQLLHLHSAINIKNQVSDCDRAVIDSKQ